MRYLPNHELQFNLLFQVLNSLIVVQVSYLPRKTMRQMTELGFIVFGKFSSPLASLNTAIGVSGNLEPGLIIQLKIKQYFI